MRGSCGRRSLWALGLIAYLLLYYSMSDQGSTREVRGAGSAMSTGGRKRECEMKRK